MPVPIYIALFFLPCYLVMKNAESSKRELSFHESTFCLSYLTGFALSLLIFIGDMMRESYENNDYVEYFGILKINVEKTNWFYQKIFTIDAISFTFIIMVVVYSIKLIMHIAKRVKLNKRND